MYKNIVHLKSKYCTLNRNLQISTSTNTKPVTNYTYNKHVWIHFGMTNYIHFLLFNLQHISTLVISVSHIVLHMSALTKLVYITDVKYPSYFQGLSEGLSEKLEHAS